jgi:hypothetical protein
MMAGSGPQIASVATGMTPAITIVSPGCGSVAMNRPSPPPETVADRRRRDDLEVAVRKRRR